MQWYFKVLKNYVGFSGRASRTEFWMFNLINTIVYILLMLLMLSKVDFSNNHDLEASVSANLFYWVYVIYYWGTLLPSLAVLVRRLHDTDKSGLWALLIFVPFGFIAIFIFCVTAGTIGRNRFGSDPWGFDDDFDDEYDDEYDEHDYNYRPQNNVRKTATPNWPQRDVSQYEAQNQSRPQRQDVYNLDQPYDENSLASPQRKSRQQADSLSSYKDPFASDPNENHYYQRFGLSDEEFKPEDNASKNSNSISNDKR